MKLKEWRRAFVNSNEYIASNRNLVINANNRRINQSQIYKMEYKMIYSKTKIINIFQISCIYKISTNTVQFKINNNFSYLNPKQNHTKNKTIFSLFKISNINSSPYLFKTLSSIKTAKYKHNIINLHQTYTSNYLFSTITFKHLLIIFYYDIYI